MSSTVVAKFIRKSKKDGAPTTPHESSRVSAPNRLELFTPRYSGNNYGPAGEPTKQMKAKVCGPYHKRDELMDLMKKHCGRNASIISKFKAPLPKSEQHYEI